MYPIPPGEKLVEAKTCRHCSASFPITDKDLEFYDKVSPVFAGKKYPIPAPTLCPECRQRRRLSFRNERKLYKRKCDATQKDIVSMYPCEMKSSGCVPDKICKVYDQSYWWSDDWDPLSYGREFDFSRPFFEQFGDLLKEVPRANLLNTDANGSDYVNFTSHMEKCYLMFDSIGCAETYYGYNGIECKKCIDVLESSNCENSSNIVDCHNSQNIHFGWGCINSHDSRYVVDLENSSFCFLSDTVFNKSYFFENVQYSKEAYFEKVKEFELLPQRTKEEKIQQWQKRYKEEKVYPYHLSVQFENSTGSGLNNTKNAHYAFSLQEGENLKYCRNSENLTNSEDTESVGVGGDLCYEFNGGVRSYAILFSFGCGGDHLMYSYQCLASHCFGCIGLRNKSYCIFNKQYTKEQYEELVPRIIEHMMKKTTPPRSSAPLHSEGECEWGEFFPSSISPFGYNETIAQEYYPLTRDNVILANAGIHGDTRTMDPPEGSPLGPVSSPGGRYLKHGNVFNWSDYEAPFPKVEKIIPASKLPDDISKIPDDILNWAIECEITKKPFRVIPQELEFYRKHNIAIPKRHPDVRHADRVAIKNPWALFIRVCDCPKCEQNASEQSRPLQEVPKERLTAEFPHSEEYEAIRAEDGMLRRIFLTTYAPTRPEIVYCGVCYLKSVL